MWNLKDLEKETSKLINKYPKEKEKILKYKKDFINMYNDYINVNAIYKIMENEIVPNFRNKIEYFDEVDRIIDLMEKVTYIFDSSIEEFKEHIFIEEYFPSMRNWIDGLELDSLEDLHHIQLAILEIDNKC